MRERRKHKTLLRSVIHEIATDFHKSGQMDDKTMAEFDKSCLVPKPVTKSETEVLPKTDET